METNYSKIFYMGIAYGTYPKEGSKIKKEGLSITKLGREFPYLLGEGRRAMGKLRVYYALLPEFRKKTFLTGKSRRWKEPMVRRLLEDACGKAALTLDCTEQVLTPELSSNEERVPLELTAACLFCQRPFDKVCITLPDDGGEYDVQQLMELLRPYLPRIRQVIFTGDENSAYEVLEDQLYEEFGIVMAKALKAPSDMPWLDMRDKTADPVHTKKASNVPRHINRPATLKFLDTAVKNGYNTKVN